MNTDIFMESFKEAVQVNVNDSPGVNIAPSENLVLHRVWLQEET